MKSTSKKISGKFIAVVIATVALPLMVQAQSTNQIGSLEVLPNNILTIIPPDDFSFEPTFKLDTGGSTYLYKTLDPQFDTQKVKVIDTDNSRGFTLNISLSNLTTSSSDSISYTNISLVTLANSSTTSVDYGPSNNPPSSLMNASLDCNWDPQNTNYPRMEDYCGTSMFAFTEPTCSGICPLPTSNEITIMENLNDTDVGEYSVGFGFQLALNDLMNSGDYQGDITFTLIPN